MKYTGLKFWAKSLNCPSPSHSSTLLPLVHKSLFLYRINSIEFCQFLILFRDSQKFIVFLKFLMRIYFGMVMAVCTCLWSLCFFFWVFMSIGLQYLILGIILYYTLQFSSFCHLFSACLYVTILWLYFYVIKSIDLL